MAVGSRLQASGSLRLAGAGALASESQHMGATPAGARDATRRLFARTLSWTQAINLRSETRLAVTGCHNPPYPYVLRPQEQTDRILLCAIAHELHMHGLYSTASSRAVRRPYTQGSPRGTNVSSRFRKRRFADSFTRSHNSISSGHSSSSESSVVDVVGDVLDVLEPVPASTPSAPSPRVSNSCGHS